MTKSIDDLERRQADCDGRLARVEQALLLLARGEQATMKSSLPHPVNMAVHWWSSALFPTEAMVTSVGCGYVEIDRYRVTWDLRDEMPWSVSELHRDGKVERLAGHKTYEEALAYVIESICKEAEDSQPK